MAWLLISMCFGNSATNSGKKMFANSEYPGEIVIRALLAISEAIWIFWLLSREEAKIIYTIKTFLFSIRLQQ